MRTRLDILIAVMERREVFTTDPKRKETCCGIQRDEDGFCQHRPYHPIYVEPEMRYTFRWKDHSGDIYPSTFAKVEDAVDWQKKNLPYADLRLLKAPIVQYEEVSPDEEAL